MRGRTLFPHALEAVEKEVQAELQLVHAVVPSRDHLLRHSIEVGEVRGRDHLAQALKVEAMSLYNHVVGKDDLLTGLVELVASELEAPRPGGDWMAAMRRRAQTAHAVLNRHPSPARSSRPS